MNNCFLDSVHKIIGLSSNLVPTKIDLIFAEKFEPFEFVAWRSPKSHCSVKCGPGVKTVTEVNCIQNSIEDTTCESKVYKEDCNERECPKGMSVWSEWSKCSKDCISSGAEQSLKHAHEPVTLHHANFAVWKFCLAKSQFASLHVQNMLLRKS